MKLNEEEASRRGAIKGWIRTYILEDSNGDIRGTVVLESDDAYRANANDPEQDKWYGRLRELLEADLSGTTASSAKKGVDPSADWRCNDGLARDTVG